ncbi:acetate kinase [Catenovulum sp. SM1970]|uniref:acetate kinase n=1 Tax=Marinifaba aquimaris TaxID=2741323 RepID=UPI0015734640|nr:acetate kinase [Marinifaba aquimaris]NTS75564.1 acetate kinase [Marinifaba aquimaris]
MTEGQFALVLNCGSSSLKFAIVNTDTAENILTGLAECLGADDARIEWKLDGKKQGLSLGADAMHQVAIDQLVKLIHQQDLDTCLSAVGHRVVHGGEQFTQSVLINAEVKATIKEMSKLAPLHNPANLLGIEAAQKSFPHLPQVAVFDTAFHQTMPQQAYLYALPKALYKQHGIRRYGFHGTSHYFVTQQAAKTLNKPVLEVNLITAHLGNGCSVSAVKNGQSVDTSMGLTPLAGLVMGTRSGDVDPGIVMYLNQQLGHSIDEIDKVLNKQSGLLGISEFSNDCRALEEAAAENNPGAQLALEVFSYQLAKFIAAYTVPLGRLDALVFTGGIGENSSFIRQTVLNHLTIFGFELDEQANLAARFGNTGIITRESSPKALVIPTNEELVIAQDAVRISSEEA